MTSLCVFEPTGQTREKYGDAQRQYVCIVCGLQVWSKFESEEIHARCAVQEIQQDKGVGTELHKLISAEGADISADCQCVARINAMNNRGITWCESNKKRIVRWIEQAAGEQGIASYRVAVSTGTIKAWRACVRLQLVDRAIRAAKSEQRI